MEEKTFKSCLYWMSMIGIAGFSWMFIGYVALMIFPQMPFNMGFRFATLIVLGIILIPLSLLMIGIIYIIRLSELLIKKKIDIVLYVCVLIIVLCCLLYLIDILFPPFFAFISCIIFGLLYIKYMWKNYE